jgi:hypothetical protein
MEKKPRMTIGCSGSFLFILVTAYTDPPKLCARIMMWCLSPDDWDGSASGGAVQYLHGVLGNDHYGAQVPTYLVPTVERWPPFQFD